MNFLENIKMAMDNIKSNKMRSFLTMLGIIIGISSVITIVSLGEGGREEITGEFEKIGASMVNVTVDPLKASSRDYITLKDSHDIKDKINSIKYVTPIIQQNAFVTSDNKNKNAVVTGGNTDLYYIQNAEVIYGRFFNAREYENGESVVVLDKGSAKALFGYEDAVGKSIKIGKQGVMKKAKIVGIIKGYENAFVSQENTNMPVFIYSPITFVEKLFPDKAYISNLSIMAESKMETESAGNSAITLLELKHGNKNKGIYKADAALKQLDQVNKVLNIFTTFIGAVAAISLLVGGIGVMNIMLVSVTERTREIGIRKAIGAKTKDIMLQFLTESIIISVIGGLIGTIVGILGSQLIGSIAHISPKISIKAILVAILFSSAVGIFFGIYPAKKAAKLNPVDALRYE